VNISKHKPHIVASGANPSRGLRITAASKNGVASINILGYIANWSDANSGKIREQITELSSTAKKAEIYINSEGGSVFEANEIVNLIQDTFEEVKVIGGALIASAASFIFCSFPNEIAENSQVMIHKPSAGLMGTATQIKKKLKMLQAAEDQYLQVYANKTGKTVAEVTALWNDGDHWMSASEAVTEGFADKIKGVAQVDDSTALALVACGAPQQQEPNLKTDMNLEVMALSLGLPKTATEAEVQAKINELKAASLEKDQLQAKLDNLQANAQAAKVKALLDKAENEKKITASQRAKYENLAKNDFETVEAILTDMSPAQPLSAQIDQEPKGGDGKSGYKTYKEYLEAGADEAWEAFAAANPTEAKKMIETYYNEN
jgi:ATP-dependent protease ClpP protease subunit